jgi:hypothetical protein
MKLMLSDQVKSALCAIALLVCIAGGCKRFQNLTHPTVLTSKDGKFQLTVPAGWQERSSLSGIASIKAANLYQEAYVIVIEESKADFTGEMTLDKFTEITRNGMLKKVTEGDSTPPLPVTINGIPGKQYALEGVINNVKISYLVTAVETSSHFCQIVTWTLRSRIDQNQSVLLRVTNSFRASDSAPPVPQAHDPETEH